MAYTTVPTIVTGDIAIATWGNTHIKDNFSYFKDTEYHQLLKPAVTRWVLPGWYIAGTATQAIVAGVIHYIPIFVEETTTYIRIGIYVTTLSAGTADLRIFNWASGLPTTLVLSAGTVDTGTTGAKEITISKQLTRGYYFLAFRCSSTPDLQGADIATALSPPVSGLWNVGGLPNPNQVVLSVTAAYADPAPAPTAINPAIYAMVVLREN